MQHERCGDRGLEFRDAVELETRLSLVHAVSSAHRDCKRIHSCLRLEINRFLYRRVLSVLVVSIRRKADMPDLTFDSCTKRMGNLDNLLRLRDVLVIGLRRCVVHDGRKTKLQCLHRLRES